MISHMQENFSETTYHCQNKVFHWVEVSLMFSPMISNCVELSITERNITLSNFFSIFLACYRKIWMMLLCDMSLLFIFHLWILCTSFFKIPLFLNILCSHPCALHFLNILYFIFEYYILQLSKSHVFEPYVLC